MSALPITIVGGGLAGLTLGIALRQREIPVTLFEATRYPRHKVCGEFISGRGLEVLQRMGLRDKLSSAGIREAKTVSFFSGTKSSGAKELPEPALCISRFKLDALLAKEFCALNGELRQNNRWTGEFASGIVRATGRAAAPVVKGWRWFGLKIHAQNVALQSDLEMHFTSRGYVGLCRLDDNTVNICGLFRSEKTVPNLHAQWRDWLGGDPHSLLAEKIDRAIFDESSFCSIAALRLSGGGFNGDGELCLGDSIAMIPPVTGNGMSMAFESAEIAVEPIGRFSRQEITWAQAREEIMELYRTQFSRRLRCASWLQDLLFQKTAREFLFLLTARQCPLWQRVFSWTR